MSRNCIIVLTGLSGSGKTVALNVLEDLGFFSIDNLPPALFSKLLELANQPGREINRLALAMDARSGEVAEVLPPIISELRTNGQLVEVLYLEASPEILQRRYSVSRRPHPMAAEGHTLHEAIESEREMMGPLHAIADHIIDTSELSVHQLRDEINSRFAGEEPAMGRIHISILSFGFSKGLPHFADMVFDVRFLPNPYFVAELKDLPGTEPAVAEFIAAREPTAQFLEKLYDMVDFLVPHYRREGKSYLTIAIGCTGGRHRSVYVAGQLAEHLGGSGYSVKLKHRDVKAGSVSDESTVT